MAVIWKKVGIDAISEWAIESWVDLSQKMVDEWLK